MSRTRLPKLLGRFVYPAYRQGQITHPLSGKGILSIRIITLVRYPHLGLRWSNPRAQGLIGNVSVHGEIQAQPVIVPRFRLWI